MANGHPKFGGTNGVPVLDIGQIGGTRHGNSHAFFSGQVHLGPDQETSVRHDVPQQNVSFRDKLGYTGRRVTWVGTIRTDTAARLNTIISEIEQRKHGSLRDSQTGELGAVNPAIIKETQLTDYDGSVMSGKAVLRDWRARDRRLSSSEWGVILQVAIEFELLG